MASPKPSASWQDIRRLLASKSKTELLNLLRDLYILNTDNKDFIHANVLTPKTVPPHPTTPKTHQPKKPPSNTAKRIDTMLVRWFPQRAAVGYSRWTDRSIHLCFKTPRATFTARGSSVMRPLSWVSDERDHPLVRLVTSDVAPSLTGHRSLTLARGF